MIMIFIRTMNVNQYHHEVCYIISAPNAYSTVKEVKFISDVSYSKFVIFFRTL